MEIRYQVFVSSTYEDLHEERAEVMQALLELDCMPAGMELFPAASEEQWKWIKRVIDESDYYIVIIAGKYGSVNADAGISYSEMEYEYAVSSGKPTIGFVIDKSVSLPEARIEIDKERRQQLDAFKQTVQKRLCKFWENTPDLGAKVSRSITQLIKREPATGWVRADAFSKVESEENLRLRNRILELESLLAGTRADSNNSEDKELARGSDTYTLKFLIREVIERKDDKGQIRHQGEKLGEVNVKTTWDAISIAIGFALLVPARREDVVDSIVRRFTRSHEDLQLDELARKYNVKDDQVHILLAIENIEQIKIQFMALGFLQVITREEKSTSTLASIFGPRKTEYWTPTEEGARYFVKKLALKRGGDVP